MIHIITILAVLGLFFSEYKETQNLHEIELQLLKLECEVAK